MKIAFLGALTCFEISRAQGKPEDTSRVWCTREFIMFRQNLPLYAVLRRTCTPMGLMKVFHPLCEPIARKPRLAVYSAHTG